MVFYPLAKDRREKINELQALIFDEESASDAQKFIAPPKWPVLDFMSDFFAKKIVKIFFRRRKMKRRESSETRFPKVSCQSEPSLSGKRPFEVSKIFSKFAKSVIFRSLIDVFYDEKGFH